jgi:TolA-binding protein
LWNRLRFHLTLIVSALPVCIVLTGTVLLSPIKLCAQIQPDHQRTTLDQRSEALDPAREETGEQRLDEFRDYPMPEEALFGLEEEIYRSQSLAQLENSVDLFRSLGAFSGTRSRKAQSELDRIIQGTDPQSHLFALASLLSALEYYSHLPLRREDVEAGLARLDRLTDSAAIPSDIKCEYYLWHAEGERALGFVTLAMSDYKRGLISTQNPECIGLMLFRRAELEEAQSMLIAADSDFFAARNIEGSHLQLLSSLRRAAILRSLSKFSGVLLELHVTDSLDNISIKSAQFSAREFLYSSPLINTMYLSPSEEERMLERSLNPLDSLLFAEPSPSDLPREHSIQLASPFILSEIALLRGSALSELHRFDSADVVLKSGIVSLAKFQDTVGSHFIARLRDFLGDALKFEDAWALFNQQKYPEAATAFLALASSDTTKRRMVKHDQNLTLREQGRFADPFYEDHSTIAVTTLDSSILNQRYLDTTFFIFNDFPERARFYAGVAQARSGNYQKAEQIFVSLVQDKSVIYSSRARYQLGLVRFIRRNYIEAASILEPLSGEKSLSGAFSSLLMGEICYRKNEYEAAERYFREALDLLPDSMKTLRATAYLERGLALIPLGAWKASASDIREYQRLSPAAPKTTADTARTVEAMFWLGKAYFRSGVVDSARALFSQLLLEFPTHARAIDAEYNYAWSLFRLNDFRSAEPTFEKVIAMDSVTRYSYDALSRSGDSYYALADYDDAIETYNWAVDRPAFNDYRTSRALFQLGVTRMREDSGRSAMNVFHHLLKKFPNSGLGDRAHLNAALAGYSINQNDEAEKDIDALVHDFPQSALSSRGLLFEADRRVERAQLQGALPLYHKIVDVYPTSGEAEPALFTLQDLLVKLKRPDEAIAIADSFVVRDTTTALVPQILLHRGKIEYGAGYWKRSMVTMNGLVDKYHDNEILPEAIYYLGRNSLAEHDTVAAIFQFERVNREHPDADAAAFSWLQLARISRARKQTFEASNDYRTAFDQRFYSSDAAPEAFAEYAEYLVERSMKDSAITMLHTLAYLYSVQTRTGAKAELRASELLEAEGKHNQAEAELLLVAEHRTDEIAGTARIRLGYAAIRTTQWKEALTEFAKAKSEDVLSDDLEMRRLFGVAQAAIALKQKPVAIAALKSLLSDYYLSASEKERATGMMDKINPPKKVAKHKTAKKGKGHRG